MSRIYDYLQKQLKSEEHRKDAEDCLKIYEKLKDISKGCAIHNHWRQLVDTHYGRFGSRERTYKPTKIGRMFLKRIEEDKKKEHKTGVLCMTAQIAIMSHLSDAQEFLSIGIGVGGKSDALKRINFAKYLLLKYPDTSVEVSEEELNEHWKKVNG